MKNILLFLAAVTAGSTVIAQPILTAANSNPVPGNKLFSHISSRVGITKGGSGVGVTWDYHDIEQASLPLDSAIFYSCSDTNHFCGSVSADIATKIGTWGYKCFNTTTDKMVEIADVRPGQDWTYTDSRTVMFYPMSYGTVRVDTFYKSQPTFGNSTYGIDTFISDGYGTLILPTATFGNALRIHVTNNFTESTSYPGYPHSASGRYDEYRWYTPDVHGPLMVMIFDESSDGVTPSSTTYYTTKFVNAVADVENSIGEVSVAPNPASNTARVSINMTNSGTVKLSAVDMIGRAAGTSVTQSVHSGKSDLSFDVSALPDGMYILRVETSGGTVQKKMQVLR